MDWHVQQRGAVWGIRRTGSGRCIGTLQTRAEAIAEAVHQAQKTSGAVFVHRADGTIARRIPKL